MFQSSSICKSAVHAGVIPDERGGFVDVMPVEKKKSYVGSLKNGVQSERWVFFSLYFPLILDCVFSGTSKSAGISQKGWWIGNM